MHPEPTHAMHRTVMKGTAALALVLTVTLFACFSSDDDGGTGPNGNGNGNGDVVVVNMQPDLTFSPAHVQIRSGQTIRWVNTSNFDHTSTADPAKSLDPESNVELPEGAQTWDSGSMAPGASFERAFTVTGDYTYFCDPHESQGMIGTITVVQ